MTRRDFLCASTGFAVSAPRRAPPTPAIDAHVHFYDPARAQGVPWPAKTDSLLHAPHLPPDFRAGATPCNVVGAVVVEASDWLEDNQWLLDLADTSPDIVGVVGRLELDHPEFAAQFRRFSAHALFRGLRLKLSDLKRVDRPAFDAGLRRVTDAGLTVDVLGGPTMLPAVDALAARFPSLRIVVNHLPFKEWNGDPSAIVRALGAVAARPNIYIKISDFVRSVDGRAIEDSAFYRPGFDALCQLFGPDRVLYASNWPVSNRVAPYRTGHRLAADYFTDHGKATTEKFFWRNSLAIYRWQRRGAAAALD